MTIALFRFYEELNDFIAPERRKREFAYRCAREASVKNVIAVAAGTAAAADLQASARRRGRRHGGSAALIR